MCLIWKEIIMGAVHGFRPDANGDGRISQKEFKAMKKTWFRC